ncbi:MAG: hypothetical protein IJ868_00505 [Prevotella sp.]|nr:hypothetical protein [Prevotella sp.]
MEKISEHSIENFKEMIGENGAEMNIAARTSKEGKSIYAPVTKDGVKVATLSQETTGTVSLLVEKPALLTPEETQDLFQKSATVLGQINNG